MSKPEFTITLGRTGQVVRRGGADDGRTDSRPSSGSKRSIRDRLGTNSESSSKKRQRGDGKSFSQGNNGVDGARPQIGRNDLRLKLMRKNLSNRMQGDNKDHKKDLREKISRTPVRVSMLPERSEPKESSLSRRIPTMRSADDLLQADFSRRAYTSLEDFSRSRSPDRVMKTSRRLSPPRNIDELRHVPLTRTIDASRNRLLSSNNILEPSRPMGTSSVTMKAAYETSKPVQRLPPPPPTTNGSTMHRSLYTGEDVAGLLQSLGLGKYYIHFQAEEVDMTALRQMGDNDLKEMGIPMGPRKKILLAIMPRTKRQPP